MTTPIRQVLHDVFQQDFSVFRDGLGFRRAFFGKTLGIPELKRIFETVAASHVEVGGRTIPAAIYIPGKHESAPFAIIAQLHGNEPAGLAGIALAMALSEADRLDQTVIGIIGNPLAAKQYFTAWEKDPKAMQEIRDPYRCGLDLRGNLLPDMNRIPVDFMTRDASDHHTARAQELYTVGQHISGILDIHSARGDMVCITDHKRDADLEFSPIRRLLTGLADAISAGSSAAVTVQTLKTILFPLPNIVTQTGIEAGRHEDPEAPNTAASFTLSLLYTLGLTRIAPLSEKETGIFENYAVKPRLTYADLIAEGSLKAGDRVYMGRMVNGTFVPGQYEEMEAIKKHQVVARAEPSGTLFKAPSSFSGIFFSKSATLYRKDPAVGPWPVAAENLATTKFCYPCEVSEMGIKF